MATEIFSEAPAQTGPIRGARRALSPGRLAALLTVLVVLAAAFAASYVHSSAWRDARSDAFDRLGLYEASLRAAFGRFDYLPDLVARLDAVTALAAGAGDADAVNRLLESLAERSEADVIYVLDAEGLTRASSNHGEPTSFVGENYAFRPYYQEAISGRTGRFFAVGATTGRPGYFVAEPIRIGAGIAGVAVVKIEVDSLQRDWQQAGEMVFVTDADGIVFLASRPEFLYRTVRPLSQDQRARIAVARQYAGAALEPLAFAVPIGTGTMEVEGRSLLHVEEPLAALGWTVHVAVPLQGARERALLAALGILVAGSLAVTSILVAGQRAMKRESALMRDANRALAGEVAERRRTEAHLRTAQAELVQAEKLAALGRLSAAIAHELNQPLAAMRTFLAATVLLQQRGETERVEDNLDTVRDLVDRMGSITGQLKSLARPGALRREPVDLAQAVEDAARIAGPRLAAQDVTLTIQGAEGASPPLQVLGDTVRIGQVLVNLLVNAADALEGWEAERAVILQLEEAGEAVLVRVADTGPGLDASVLDHLFDPFVTTKGSEGGLGLGLSIAYGIVTDMGGTLRASNAAGGGAVFEIRWPRHGQGEDRESAPA